MTSLRTRARQLARDSSGLAMIEFAVSLPVLLSIGLLGLETAHYGIASLRMSQIAMTTADNAARVRDSIDELDVNELMTGAKLVGAPLKFADNGRIILSSVERNAAGTGQWIRWQRCAGKKNVSSSYGVQDKGKTDATLQAIGPAGNQIAATAGTALMFVEVVYDYQPIVGNRLFGAQTLRYTGAFNVRQRTDQAIKNSKNLATSQTSDCGIYSA
jgi:Flp pilus assembly protein TadG